MNYVKVDREGRPLGECADCDSSRYDYDRKTWVCVLDDDCSQGIDIWRKGASK